LVGPDWFFVSVNMHQVSILLVIEELVKARLQPIKSRPFQIEISHSLLQCKHFKLPRFSAIEEVTLISYGGNHLPLLLLVLLGLRRTVAWSKHIKDISQCAGLDLPQVIGSILFKISATE
jgi:hypothetical protein